MIIYTAIQKGTKCKYTVKEIERVFIEWEPSELSKRESIFKTKSEIIGLATKSKHKFFIMMDDDIEYISGIKGIEEEMNSRPDLGAMGIWPFENKNHDRKHVTNGLMLLRTKSILEWEPEFEYGCFCGHIYRAMKRQGFKVEYYHNGKVIHHKKRINFH